MPPPSLEILSFGPLNRPNIWVEPPWKLKNGWGALPWSPREPSPGKIPAYALVRDRSTYEKNGIGKSFATEYTRLVSYAGLAASPSQCCYFCASRSKPLYHRFRKLNDRTVDDLT